MTDGLVARLREACNGKPAKIEWPHRVLHDAANEIERLRAREAQLREALELADGALSGANMNMKVVEKKVRAALAEQGDFK